MKKEIHPGAIAVIVILVVGALVAFFMLQGGAPAEKVDIKQLSPESLQDDPVPKRGQPGYRERTTDPVGE